MNMNCSLEFLSSRRNAKGGGKERKRERENIPSTIITHKLSLERK
jgi:hypothetical protein